MGKIAPDPPVGIAGEYPDPDSCCDGWHDPAGRKHGMADGTNRYARPEDFPLDAGAAAGDPRLYWRNRTSRAFAAARRLHSAILELVIGPSG